MESVARAAPDVKVCDRVQMFEQGVPLLLRTALVVCLR